jgi:hypothetical protein
MQASYIWIEHEIGEDAFRKILAKVQNTFCILAFCDKVFCQHLHPEANGFSFFATM